MKRFRCRGNFCKEHLKERDRLEDEYVWNVFGVKGMSVNSTKRRDSVEDD